jgi:hypothetical protein
MGNTRFRTLGDFAKHEANIGCICGGCGHKGVVHRDILARWCFIKRLNASLECLPGYLRCSKCGGRPSKIVPTPKLPSFPHYGRDERHWKRLQQRLRG